MTIASFVAKDIISQIIWLMQSYTLVRRPLACFFVACTEHYIPKWRGDTEVGVDMVVVDVMIGRPVSSKNSTKTVVVDCEMTQPIDNVT